MPTTYCPRIAQALPDFRFPKVFRSQLLAPKRSNCFALLIHGSAPLEKTEKSMLWFLQQERRVDPLKGLQLNR
ncbi:MAG: hypothetical protein AAGF96_14525 [Bacteroidota bacterium]